MTRERNARFMGAIAGCATARLHEFMLHPAAWRAKRMSARATPGGRERRWNRDAPAPVEEPTSHPETSIMKSSLIACAAALLVLAATSAADAKGCIKGAVVGGVAGHYAGHHGVLGAAAGCLYGRHHAKEQQQQQGRQQQSQTNGQGKL